MAFDWYAGTIHHPDLATDPEAVREAALAAFPGSVYAPAEKGASGYAHRVTIGYECVDRRGRPDIRRICDLLSGGNPGVHVVASGCYSPQVAGFLRELAPETHRLSRADAAIDFAVPGLFDRIDAVLVAFAVRRGLKVGCSGDWERGRARTRYVGSRSSPVYLRWYEKGHKDGGMPDWCRLEVEVKPKTRDAGFEFAHLSPFDLLGSSKWLTDLFLELGAITAEPVAAGSIRKASDDARVRFHLVRQYGRAMERWRSQCATEADFLRELSVWLNVVRDHPDRRLPETLHALQVEHGIVVADAAL